MPDIVSERPDAALISFVVPVFNEQDAIPIFIEALDAAMSKQRERYEVVFVNDGSLDETLAVLRRMNDADPRYRFVDLSRNFGKEAAMTAGLEFALGDAVCVMDVDLQDPPELVPEMVLQWRAGYDVVNARRGSRKVDTAFKRTTAGVFYKLFNTMSDAKIPSDVGDFRLMDRKVVDVLNLLPERVRFMKGLFAWVGFETCSVTFERQERHSGKSRFNYWRLWNFALDGITSFSTVPLRMWSYLGLAVAAISFLYALAIITRTLVFGIESPGYASTLTVVLFLGGIQLIGLGIIGEYLGRVFVEVKRRPTHIVASVSPEPARTSTGGE